MALYAKLTTYPPLGQLTLLPSEQKDVVFTVLLECSKAIPNFPWEVKLFYKDITRQDEETKWNEQTLEKSSALPNLLNETERDPDPMLSCHRNAFTTKLLLEKEDKIMRYLRFTVKYRIDSDSPWYEAEMQFGVKNAEIMLQHPVEKDVDISSIIDLGFGWTSSPLGKTVEKTTTFRLQSTLLAAAGGPISSSTSVLGEIKEQERFFALIQMPEAWLATRHGLRKFDIPEEAIMCSFLTSTGQCVTLLGLSGFDYVKVMFKSTEDGKIAVFARNDGTKSAFAQIVLTVAGTLEQSITQAMDTARDLLHESKTKAAGKVDADTRTHKWVGSNDTQHELNDWYDGLAYCTWNSLGADLTIPRILSGLDSLEKAGIKVSTLIVDDNWQSIDYDWSETPRMHQGWERFEAVEHAFPDGLAAAVSEIREKHPYLKDIAVWHALLGYWGGISPTGKLAKDYESISIPARLLVEHKKQNITAIDPSAIHNFYDDFYTFLASCGITSVKTDVQYMLEELQSGPDRARFLSEYPSAWTAAHLKHFSGRAISCMSMIPQNLLLTYLPTETPKVLLRNSDDFFPEIATSHPWHLFINAHNVLFTQHLNVLPDWDMFQTSHPYSAFHAAARCVSGGPIYITDVPGEHDVELIKQMSAESPEGKTIALRPTRLGRTLNGFDNFLEGHVLKIGAYTEFENNGGVGIMGLFNIAEKETSCLISVAGFPSSNFPNSQSENGEGEGEILIRSHRTNTIFPPVASNSTTPESLLYALLPARGFEVLSSYRIQSFPSFKPGKYAVLGLLGKMTGAAAVTTYSVVDEQEDEKFQLVVRLKALGVLGIWLDKDNEGEGIKVLVKENEISEECWSFEILEGRDDADGRDGEETKEAKGSGVLLSIDVERAWKDGGHEAGRGESVEVVIRWETTE